MQRWAIGLEYHGGPFAGWQNQTHAASIQNAVEQALGRVADAPIAVTGAGRTDAGVHAIGQVGHFDTAVQRDARSWLLGTNSKLPDSVCVTWAKSVASGFHARYSATSRSYRYLILNRGVRSALLADRSWWLHGDLDVPAMDDAARHLLGEHDFSAFRAAECQSRSPMRTIQRISVRRIDEQIIIDCTANAFLHHMVRNIVGSLVVVGRRQQSPAWLPEVLASRDRRRAGSTAPAQGLVLERVDYPAEFAIPLPSPLAAGQPQSDL